MLACLVSPCCLEAYERETNEYLRARPCPDCGASIVMIYDDTPHLGLQCRSCGKVYDRMQGSQAPGFPPQCPKCGTPAVAEVGPDDTIDIGARLAPTPYRSSD